MTSHDVVSRCRRIFSTRRGWPRRDAGPDGHRRAGDRHRPCHQDPRPAHRGRRSRMPPPSAWARPPPPRTPKGNCCNRFRPAEVTAEDIAAAMAVLRGDIKQVPSAVSAIKVDGRRAYQLVREGHTVELAGAAGAHRTVRGARGATATIDSSTSTSRSTARREPTSALWPAISATRSGSAGI